MMLQHISSLFLVNRYRHTGQWEVTNVFRRPNGVATAMKFSGETFLLPSIRIYMHWPRRVLPCKIIMSLTIIME